MTPNYEQEIINDIFRIARTVKKHINEPNCVHNIRSIVDEALGSNGTGPVSQTSPAPDQTNGDAIIQARNPNDYENRIRK